MSTELTAVDLVRTLGNEACHASLLKGMVGGLISMWLTGEAECHPWG